MTYARVGLPLPDTPPLRAQGILHGELRFQSHVSSSAAAMIGALLERDPARRLGSMGAQEVMDHAFFANVDWEKLSLREVKAPFVPPGGGGDASNFDTEFTSLSVESERHHHTPALRTDVFDGFNFDHEAPKDVRRDAAGVASMRALALSDADQVVTEEGEF